MTTLFPAMLLAAALGAAPTADIQTAAGGVESGTLLEIRDDALAVETAKGRVSLKLDEITGITVKEPKPAAAAQAAVWIELTDGSSLAGAAFSTEGDKAKLKLSSDGDLEIPVQAIRWVRFQPHADAAARQWSELLEQDNRVDRLIVKKGDALNYHKGAVGKIDEETIQFELDGEKLPVKRAKVYAVVFHQVEGREPPAAKCMIADAAGMTWAAQSIAVANNEVSWTTPTGLKLTRPLASLVRLDFSQGKVVYLSDLKPESVDWLPYFSIGKELPSRTAFYAPRQDKALGAGPLQVGGQRYKKGLAIHSRTTLVYRLPDRFGRFVAIAGIDDRVRPRGNVQLTVRGDDRELFSETISGSDGPKPLDLDVSGVRRLTIVVDFGEDLDIADHLDLCEARFIK